MGILRNVFGPSREEIWRQLSAEIDGRYVQRPWKRDKVEAVHGPWTVTLDRYVVSTGKSSAVFTRMRAPFVNAQGFRFRIHRKGLFGDLAKWLGIEDIDVGFPEFDDAFVIRGN